MDHQLGVSNREVSSTAPDVLWRGNKWGHVLVLCLMVENMLLYKKNHYQQSVSGRREAGPAEWVVLPVGPLLDVELNNQGSGNDFTFH